MKLVLKIQINTLISEVTIEPNSTITIGRTDKSNVKIPDPLLSGIHCKFQYHPPKLEIKDMESKNGTYLNGLRVERSDVFIGDEIKMGDTKVMILSEKMDPNAVKALSFPGQARDRVAHELQLDYTGAGMVPQGYAGLPGTERKSTTTINNHINERRQAQSTIKLSKKEIKLRNKRASSQAKTLDTLFFIAALAIPLIATNFVLMLAPSTFKTNRLMIILAGEIIAGGLFYWINFKLLKFTLGEKASGIQKLYDDQEESD